MLQRQYEKNKIIRLKSYTLLTLTKKKHIAKMTDWTKTISSNWRIPQQIKKLQTEGKVEGLTLGTTEGPVLGLVLA